MPDYDYQSTVRNWLRVRGRQERETAGIVAELESVIAKHTAEARAEPLFPWEVAKSARAFEMSIAKQGFAIMIPSGLRTWPELLAWGRKRRNSFNIRTWARSVRLTDRWRDLFEPKDLYTFFVVLRVFTSHCRESNRPRNERLRRLELDVFLVFQRHQLPWRGSPHAADILAKIKARFLGGEVSIEPDSALRDAVRRYSGVSRARKRLA